MKMEIKFTKDSAEFEIGFALYDYPTILEAAKEFTDTCFVLMQGDDSGDSLLIRFEPKDSDIDVKDAVYSFFNYMLGIANGKIKNLSEQ